MTYYSLRLKSLPSPSLRSSGFVRSNLAQYENALCVRVCTARARSVHAVQNLYGPSSSLACLIKEKNVFLYSNEITRKGIARHRFPLNVSHSSLPAFIVSFFLFFPSPCSPPLPPHPHVCPLRPRLRPYLSSLIYYVYITILYCRT